jgi:hypothetical protein
LFQTREQSLELEVRLVALLDGPGSLRVACAVERALAQPPSCAPGYRRGDA